MARNELAPLVTTLEARISRFEKQLAKASGTVDRQAGRQEKRWRTQHSRVDRRFKGMGNSMKAGLLIGTAAVTALTASMTAGVAGALKYATELNNSANIAGVTAERIQELTFASTKFGISQEKLSDILKDTNDKFGDFFATGAGPLVDFFDNIAPKVGLTAESFKNLSSDQALGLYVSSLEKAGASQQDMTFYMEALASDATALLPLLRGNGRELNRFAKEARDAGIVLSSDAVNGAVAADRALEKLSDTLRGNLRAAIVEAAPEIESLAANLEELGPRLSAWFTNLVKFANNAADGWAEAFARMNRLSLGLNLAKQGEFKLAKQVLDATRTRTQLEAEAAKISEKQADNLAKQLEFTQAIKAAEKDGNSRLAKNNQRFLDRQREMAEGLADERKKIEQQISSLSGANEPATPIGSAQAVERPVSQSKSPFLDTNTRRDAADAIIVAEIEAIREVGKLESEQIQELLAERLASIEKAKIADGEKAQLRANVHADAQRELKLIADAEAEFRAQAMADIEAQQEADFRANQDRLGFAAEIAAATARMSGRALEATKIELDATRARYEAELAYIDAVIAKKGESDDLLAQRDNARAGIASTDEAQASLRSSAKNSIRGISDGAGDDTLDAKLTQLKEEQAAKLVQLEQFRSDDLDMVRLYEEEKLQIEAEYSQKRKQLRLADIDAQLNAASSLVDSIGRIGKEGSKAQKEAAKVQKGIALGQAAINTYQAVSAAVASAPFPFNVPAIAFATATGGAQIAGIAAQNFAKGGVGISGRGTTTSDSIPANLSRGESVITAKATRGNESGLRGLNKGLTPAEAFGFDVPQSSFTPSQFTGLSQSNISVGGASITINGNADNAAISRLETMLANDRKNRAREFTMMANQRDKRLTSRKDRKVGI